MRPRRTWWLWAAVTLAALTAGIALAAVVAVRFWPKRAIEAAPTPSLVFAALAVAPPGEPMDAAARVRLQGFGIAADRLLLDALDAPSWTRAGAWRLLADGHYHRPEVLAAARDRIRPYLTSASPLERHAARAAYASDPDELALEWMTTRPPADGLWPGAANAVAGDHAPGPIGVTALIVIATAIHQWRIPRVDSAMAALLAARDQDGSWPGDLRDAALATWALAQANSISGGHRRSDDVARAIDALSARIDVARAGDAWAASLAMRAMEVWYGDCDDLVAHLRDVPAGWSTTAAIAARWRAACPSASIADVDADALRALAFGCCGRAPVADREAAADAAAAVDPLRWTPALLAMAASGIGHGHAIWDRWYATARRTVVDAQRLGDPALDGSWDPPGGDERDRVVVTAWRTLTLLAWRHER